MNLLFLGLCSLHLSSLEAEQAKLVPEKWQAVFSDKLSSWDLPLLLPFLWLFFLRMRQWHQLLNSLYLVQEKQKKVFVRHCSLNPEISVLLCSPFPHSLLSFVIPASSIYKMPVPVRKYLVFLFSGLFPVFPPLQADCIFRDRLRCLRWWRMTAILFLQTSPFWFGSWLGFSDIFNNDWADSLFPNVSSAFNSRTIKM